MSVAEMRENRSPTLDRKSRPFTGKLRRASSLTGNIGKDRASPTRAATQPFPTTEQFAGAGTPLHRIQTEEGLRSPDRKHIKPSQEPQSVSRQDSRGKRRHAPHHPTINRKAFIAVMGATGSGKTSFVNLVTGSNLEVSNALVSCTQLVALGSKLEFEGYEVNLIDTPGFDDTDRSEVEILKTIAKYLQTLHQSKIKLHGVIFLYRISDFRMSGSSRRSLQLFKAICGDKALQNTMIVTTMWDNVVPKDGVEREKQLKDGEEFFKPFILKNAKTYRHDKGIASARHIISLMLRNKPCPLAIQTEMVNDHKQLLETGAGLQLSGEIQKTIQDLNNQLAASEAAEENMSISNRRVDDADFNDDEEYERQQLLKQLTRYQREMKSLEDDYHAEGGEHLNHQNFRRLRGDIARLLRRLPRRFRKTGRSREVTNDGPGDALR